MKLSKKKKMTSFYCPLAMPLEDYALYAGVTALGGLMCGVLIGQSVALLCMSSGSNIQQVAENMFYGNIIGTAIPLAAAGLMIGLPASKMLIYKIKQIKEEKQMEQSL